MYAGVDPDTGRQKHAPGIAQNFDEAVADGTQTRLTRVDVATHDANRRAALRGQSPSAAFTDEWLEAMRGRSLVDGLVGRLLAAA